MKFKPNPIELELTDEQIANYPSYSWPLRCCWCGSGIGAQVRAPEVEGLRFICQMCNKPNAVRRRGNRVYISPMTGSPIGCVVVLFVIIALCWFGVSKLPTIHLPSLAFPRVSGFMAHAMIWLGHGVALFTLIGLPFQISRWLAVRRLYGRIPWSLVWQVAVYARKNRRLRLQIWVLVAMFLLFAGAGINWIGVDFGWLRPFDDTARSLRLPAFLIFIWQLGRVFGYLLPPTALLLGTAKSVNIHLVAVLNNELRPYRVVSLLDLEKEHIIPLLARTVMYNNLRTVNGYEWRTVVHHLMDVVPLIIVDTAVRTEYVEAEQHRIEYFGYSYKVISYSSAAYGSKISALESGIGDVVDAAQKLGEELVPSIQSQLPKIADQDRRWKAQREYTAMVRSVPRPIRFHSDINAMLIKAQCILGWAMENFLRDCKQAPAGTPPESLIEDLPSRVTPAEEMAYLRQSRGLDEVRGIAFSALDLAAQTPGPQQEFNVANAHNKIGKWARFTRDWDAALIHLGKGIEILTPMGKGGGPLVNERQRIQQELADAHFLRGEVFMARFRQTALPTDRERAVAEFCACMALDVTLGNDTAQSARRLASLE